MKSSRFTEAQIIAILKEADAGILVKDICRKHGIIDATYYNWKSKYGGMTASDLKRMKETEAELLTKGIMWRGYITRGVIYHTEAQIIGSGYQEAYSKEKEVAAFKRTADERGTPFVEVDPVICDYVKSHSDDCVKNNVCSNGKWRWGKPLALLKKVSKGDKGK